MPDNAYRYNGKELDAATGLYDYGARYYDPAVARWGQVDPLADQYAPYSPYNYVLGNPISLIDPDGQKVIFPTFGMNKLFRNLARIIATDHGNSKVRTLVSSSSNYVINRIFWTKNSGYDWSGTDGPRGVVYVPNESWTSQLDGGSMESYQILFHELNHAYSHELARQAIFPREPREPSRESLEGSAVHNTNKLRAIHGETRMRTGYTGLLSLSFSDDPSFYNPDGIGVSNFIFGDIMNSNSSTIQGFEYDHNDGAGCTSTKYGVIWSTPDSRGNNVIDYKLFNDRGEYNSFLSSFGNSSSETNGSN